MNAPSFTIESTDNGGIDEVLGQFSADDATNADANVDDDHDDDDDDAGSIIKLSKFKRCCKRVTLAFDHYITSII